MSVCWRVKEKENTAHLPVPFQSTAPGSQMSDLFSPGTAERANKQCVCVCVCVCVGVGLCVFERAKRKRLLEMVDEFKIHVSYMKCKK